VGRQRRLAAVGPAAPARAHGVLVSRAGAAVRHAPQFWYPARALLFATRRWGDPRFLQAWEEIYAGRMAGDTVERIRHAAGDHTANKAVECVAWHQLRRWNARWVGGELVADPYVLPGERLHATIHTPTGPREVDA